MPGASGWARIRDGTESCHNRTDGQRVLPMRKWVGCPPCGERGTTGPGVLWMALVYRHCWLVRDRPSRAYDCICARNISTAASLSVSRRCRAKCNEGTKIPATPVAAVRRGPAKCLAPRLRHRREGDAAAAGTRAHLSASSHAPMDEDGFRASAAELRQQSCYNVFRGHGPGQLLSTSGGCSPGCRLRKRPLVARHCGSPRTKLEHRQKGAIEARGEMGRGQGKDFA